MGSTTPTEEPATMAQPLIALLGWRDQPTDALHDYCHWLALALERRGVSLVEAEVPWAERGWVRALVALWNQSAGWRGRWVILQYTALAWSRRGFPLGMLATLWLLRLRGTRTAVVFHSAEPQPGKRPVDRLRAACQRWVMRRASRQASRIILPVPLERAAWLGERCGVAAFIPVGSNVPANARGGETGEPGKAEGGARRTVTAAVFGVTGAPSMEREVADICFAARCANRRLPAVAGLPGLRLLVLGRGSTEAGPLLEESLAGSGIELEVLGIRPAEDVARALAGADALLFVRGEVAANRGSAVAGLACGLPIVGYGVAERSFPVNRAGARLVPCGDRAALAEALAEVLSDGNLRGELREQSRRALAEYFSWERIAERYTEVLDRG
jgi:glycosyltransferase involved in cell wall biosynthesis